MLLTRMGSRVQESSDLARLDTFPVGGTIFLAADRGELDPATAARLLDWVQRRRPSGGAASSARSRTMPLLRAARRLGASGRVPQVDPRPRTSSFPTGRACAWTCCLRLASTTTRTRRAGSTSPTARSACCRSPTRTGMVTVLSTFRPFGNHAIGRLDHAELLWRLAGAPAVSRLECGWCATWRSQSLPRWLMTQCHARPGRAGRVPAAGAVARDPALRTAAAQSRRRTAAAWSSTCRRWAASTRCSGSLPG